MQHAVELYILGREVVAGDAVAVEDMHTVTRTPLHRSQLGFRSYYTDA
jgi:hypothetical protein